jgi:chorismate mutase/prephenate dehydratase
MARKKTDSKKTTSADSSKSAALEQLRNRIDRIDAQIVQLMNERAGIALEIGKLKDAKSMEIFAPARESEVIGRVLEANKGPLDDRAIRAVYRELMSGSRALQRNIRVAYLGPEYSFSHLAALERFGGSVDFVPAANIAAVFEIVNRGQAELGVVPIENSTDGRVADTLDMFIRLPLKICGEVSLRIHQNLVSLFPIGDIRRVYSKWQALSQCRHWLATNLQQATLHEVQSTATAVKLAKEEKFAAAIASRQAAVANGVPVICEDIEDRPNNVTRFAIIGHDVAARTGSDKTSIMFETVDEPGALAETLLIMKKFNVNMTWIESFPGPQKGKRNQFIFFVDLEGHATDSPVKSVLTALEKQCTKVVKLGTFPKGLLYE